MGKILNKENIQVRFLNDNTFHPKLYIFAEQFAIVGSSNMTEKALSTNQEVNITVDPDDPRYGELLVLFNEYWDGAKILTTDQLNIYKGIYENHKANLYSLYKMEQELQEKQGKVIISNINRGLNKPKKDDVYLEAYEKTYQEFLNAYRIVERIYENSGKRKVDENSLPLRIEIDQFLNFIRDQKAPKESYKEAHILSGLELERKVKKVIEEWFNFDCKSLDYIKNESYPKIQKIFGTSESIDNSTFDQFLDALKYVHAFLVRQRWEGGYDTLRKEFQENNELQKVKKAFKYLLYGQGNFIKRMGDCIFHPDYRLSQFGRSGVQELLGWVNKENIPICNNRTLMALRWLGFDIKVIS